MLAPKDKVFVRPGFVRVQIDITNKCFNKCIYCDRYERHLREDMLWEMSPELFEKALDVCSDMPISMIGVIGGEPQMHTRFREIMEVVRARTQFGKVALFTSIDPYKSKYRDEILSTFRYIPANLHTPEQMRTCQHHPFTLAVKDMVRNRMLRDELINGCWIGDYWCFEISPLGIFHCEVAFGLAMLTGRHGWKIEKGWWKRDSMDDQKYICQYCGGCIPMEKQFLCNNKQKISKSFLNLLDNHNLPKGEYELIKEPFTPEYMSHWAKTWRPSQYRNETEAEAEATGAFLGNRVDWSKWIYP
jgi:hypothetical protein